MLEKIAINYQIGETTLEVNHQRVLKGTLTFVFAFTQKFVELYDQQRSLRDMESGTRGRVDKVGVASFPARDVPKAPEQVCA